MSGKGANLSDELKISVAIPYKRRLENIQLMLEGLAGQTMEPDEFEIVVGAMEYCQDYVALCKSYSDRLNIVSVLSSLPFEIPRARNLAMRQARGRVVLQMDADTLLPPSALRDLWYGSFSYGQVVCVVGQVLNYDNNQGGDVDEVDLQPYAYYQSILEDAAACVVEPQDPRFQVDHVIPWAFAWTGFIALPMKTVREYDLYFDEEFRGWGADDLDWGFRICTSGVPIVRRADLYALHLPHIRDSRTNRVSERLNYRRILSKWPRPDVELANAFGDFEANRLFLEYMGELQRVSCDGSSLGTVRGRVGGRDVVVMGVQLDAEGHADDDVAAMFDHARVIETLPLAGISLPFDDQTFAECRVQERLAGFSPRYWDAIRTEANRVARSVALPNGRS